MAKSKRVTATYEVGQLVEAKSGEQFRIIATDGTDNYIALDEEGVEVNLDAPFIVRVIA
jgi:hypothetical protein